MSDSLQPHGLQHARTHCPSPTPGVYSNSCPLSQWCYPTISSSLDPLLPPSIFPSIRVFSNESDLLIRWPKYWSFSFSPSNEYSGLIFFRMEWLDLLAVQGILKSLLQHHSSKTSILLCSASGEGNGKPLSILTLRTPWTVWKSLNIVTPKKIKPIKVIDCHLQKRWSYKTNVAFILGALSYPLTGSLWKEPASMLGKHPLYQLTLQMRLKSWLKVWI